VAAEADDAYLVCRAQEGYLDVRAAGRLARPAGLPGCAATGQPSRRRGRRPGGVRSHQRRRLPRRNALYRGEHCRVDRVQPDGERPRRQG
jgi:hypothetical protein